LRFKNPRRRKLNPSWWKKERESFSEWRLGTKKEKSWERWQWTHNNILILSTADRSTVWTKLLLRLFLVYKSLLINIRLLSVVLVHCIVCIFYPKVYNVCFVITTNLSWNKGNLYNISGFNTICANINTKYQSLFVAGIARISCIVIYLLLCPYRKAFKTYCPYWWKWKQICYY